MLQFFLLFLCVTSNSLRQVVERVGLSPIREKTELYLRLLMRYWGMALATHAQC